MQFTALLQVRNVDMQSAENIYRTPLVSKEWTRGAGFSGGVLLTHPSKDSGCTCQRRMFCTVNSYHDIYVYLNSDELSVLIEEALDEELL